MNIGIIVHSYTGNTYSVASELRQALQESGHHVSIEKVEVVGEENPQERRFEIETYPDTCDYDALIFGAPVRAFSISPVMETYLNQLPSLEGKKVICLVTMLFPFAWMGGRRAVRQMKEICQSKGAKVLDIGVIGWSRRHREKDIADMVRRFAAQLRSTGSCEQM